jgi:hypothetical protein
MRNYFEITAIWWHGHSLGQPNITGEFYAFGGTEEQLMSHMQPQADAMLADFPDTIFDKHGPFKVYFELNEANFAKLLQGPTAAQLPASGFAAYVWGNTRLHELPGSPQSYAGTFFYEMTEMESPRKTWSGGH